MNQLPIAILALGIGLLAWRVIWPLIRVVKWFALLILLVVLLTVFMVRGGDPHDIHPTDLWSQQLPR